MRQTLVVLHFRNTSRVPRQHIRQPGVDGAESHVRTLGLRRQVMLQLGYVVDQPTDLGPGEVAGDRQTGLEPESVCSVLTIREILGHDGVRHRRGPRVVPNDGVVIQPTRPIVPADGGLPLIRYAHCLDQEVRRQVQTVTVQSLDGAGDASGDRVPDRERIVLVPADARRRGIVRTAAREALLKLDLGGGEYLPVGRHEQVCPARSCSLPKTSSDEKQ